MLHRINGLIPCDHLYLFVLSMLFRLSEIAVTKCLTILTIIQYAMTAIINIEDPICIKSRYSGHCKNSLVILNLCHSKPLN